MKYYHTLVHIIMIAFAGASLGNVYAFFALAGHPREVALVLGLALGSALVVTSIMITQVNQETDPHAFRWLVGTALLLGSISGAIQMDVYADHLARHWSILLGFGVPLGGEVGLAFASQAFSKSKARERFRTVSDTVESAVADRLDAAISTMNPQIIQAHVEERLTQLALHAVDSVTAKARSYYQDVENPADSEETSSFGPHNLKKARARRTALYESANVERQQTILTYLDEHDAASTSAIADMLDVHRDTARTLLKAMAADELVMQGRNHKWRRSTSAASQS